LNDDVRELFDELAATLPPELRAPSGQWQPAIDVLETDEAVQVVVDVSGVPAPALRIFVRADVLLVVGEKAQEPSPPEHSFHLVEREFGRFARAVPLSGAFDIPAARASLRNGELTVYVPKRIERRGQGRRIPISTPGPGPA
jgi:HSP20 family protein